jgi:phenylacetate-coenzyme A ligase PaaK-like adenylate-forming protein
MDFVAKLIARTARLRQREYWPRLRLARYQARSLRRLRAFAYARSPFYREFHKGLADRPLHELPSLSKALLLEHFDDIVTDPVVRSADLEQHLRADAADGLFGERYHVTASSGTMGRRALLASDAHEWLATLASMSRPNAWMGLKQVPRKRRLAHVLSTVPWHISARTLRFVDRHLTTLVLLDAGDNLDSIVEHLNDLQPEVLSTYASLAKVLADEQLQGRLRIQPEAVTTGGDVLTEDTRRRVTMAWGQPPYDTYATAEGAMLAAECAYHSGLHLFEDLAIVENVNAQGHAVAPGEYGHKLLVTLLFRHTVPLIRYEIDDHARFAPWPCPCGRTLALIESIRGRAAEVLRLPHPAGGRRSIDPTFFYRVLDALPVGEWQVVHTHAGLELLVTSPRDGFSEAAVAELLGRELQACGAVPPAIHVHRVARVPRGPTGKTLLVRSEVTS